MSYILEALKKSELERNQFAASAEVEASTVSVDSASTALPSAPSSIQKFSIVYLLMIVVTVLAVVYFSFTNTMKLDESIVESQAPVSLVDEQILDKYDHSKNEKIDEVDADSNSVTSINEKPEAPVKIEEAPTQKILAVQVAVAKLDTVSVTELNALEAKIYPEKAEIEEKPEVLRIEQASESLLAKIPNISITSHIYSSQAKRRSIVVNDERLVEGDFVSAQVQVHEITHQGMILSVSGSLLAVSRSRGWNR